MTKTEQHFITWAEEIGETLALCLRTKQTQDVAKAEARLQLFLQQLGPIGAIWKRSLSSLFPSGGSFLVVGSTDKSKIPLNPMALQNVERALGAINAIKEEIENGRLASLEEKITQDLLADLMGQAEELLDRYPMASAVLLRGILEERCRTLCQKHKCVPIKAKLELYRTSLQTAGVFDKTVSDEVSFMMKVGNAAAHNDDFKPEKVPLMLEHLKGFLSSFAP
jgi:hypothetical protein